MSAKVSLGKFDEPKFPARCAWSGEEADTTYTVYGRSNGWRPGRDGAARAFKYEVPASKKHLSTIKNNERLSKVMDLIPPISGVLTAAGIYFVMEGQLQEWLMISLAVCALVVVYIAVRWVKPAAVDVQVYQDWIDFDFAKHDYFEDFAKLNGAHH